MSQALAGEPPRLEAPAGPAPESERMLYLDTGSERTFAVARLPRGTVRSATGVVLCPLFGWEDICTHRSRRRWAAALQDAGHPVIRLDLPGTGDSLGTPHAPDRLQVWIAAVDAAAAWLREEAGCGAVCAAGIGFGGMLAWLAAAEGAPIDDLLLWGTPVRGRRLLREVRAGAMLSIDGRLRVTPSKGDEGAPEDEWLLDEAGQLTTPQTIEALSKVDLLATPLSRAERRRALVLARTQDSVDETVVDHLRANGVEVTVAGGDHLGELMRYVQESEIHPSVVRTSIDWLGEPDAYRRRPHPTGDTRPPESESREGERAVLSRHDTAEFLHDGVAVRESPVSLRLADGCLSGVLTEPVQAAAVRLSVVFFSGGSDRRIGPNRMWVDMARRAAAQGAIAVRLDPPGVGDSDGDERQWDRLPMHYRPVHVARTLELLEALAACGLPDRFLMVGFCSGAYRALLAAERDERVVGVVALGLHFFRWTWWASRVRGWWLASWQPKRGDSRLKVSLFRALQGGLRVVHRAQHDVVRLAQVAPNRGERLITALDARGTELLFLLKPGSYAYEQLSLPRRRARLERLAHVHVEPLPGDDQRFRPLVSQRLVTSAVDQAMRRLIDRLRSADAA